jgi:hypothetical protein
MERLKTPFFFVAVAAMTLVVLLEVGARFLLAGHDVGATISGQAASVGTSLPASSSPPGLGISYLALVDGIALFTMLLMGLGLVVNPKVLGRLQSIVTLIFSILLILLALVLLIVAIVKLILMVTLLFAFPFGTIAYLIIWGSFPRGEAAVILSLLMFLKFVYGGFLLVAQPRFLQNKGLVLLTLTSLICNIVCAFLHGIVPGILVSITDALAGIVFSIVAIIWAIVLLIGSIPGIIRALQVTAEAAGKRPIQMLNPVPLVRRLIHRGTRAAT